MLDQLIFCSSPWLVKEGPTTGTAVVVETRLLIGEKEKGREVCERGAAKDGVLVDTE